MEELQSLEISGVHISPLVLVASGVSCFLSILGCALIILTFCLWREFRNNPRKILLYLSISDLVLSVSYFYGLLRNYETTTADCVAQSFVSTMANISSMLWTLALAVYLFIVIVLMDRELADKIMPAFHVISWGVPLIFTLILVALGGLGFGGNVVTVGWCWINIQHHYFLVWMLLAGVIWDVMSYVLVPVVCILLHSSLKKQMKMTHELPENQKRNVIYLGGIDNKLGWIPVVFIILRVWGTLRFFLYVTGSKDSPHVSNQLLLAMQGICSTLQGAMNALLCLFLTRHIRGQLVPLICCFIAPRNTTLGVSSEDDSQPGGSTDNNSNYNETITLIQRQAGEAMY